MKQRSRPVNPRGKRSSRSTHGTSKTQQATLRSIPSALVHTKTGDRVSTSSINTSDASFNRAISFSRQQSRSASGMTTKRSFSNHTPSATLGVDNMASLSVTDTPINSQRQTRPTVVQRKPSLPSFKQPAWASKQLTPQAPLITAHRAASSLSIRASWISQHNQRHSINTLPSIRIQSSHQLPAVCSSRAKAPRFLTSLQSFPFTSTAAGQPSAPFESPKGSQQNYSKTNEDSKGSQQNHSKTNADPKSDQQKSDSQQVSIHGNSSIREVNLNERSPLEDKVRLFDRIDRFLVGGLQRLRKKLSAGRVGGGGLLLALLYFLFARFLKGRAEEMLFQKFVSLPSSKAKSFASITTLSPEDIQDVFSQMAPHVANGLIPLSALCEALFKKVEEKRKERKEENETLQFLYQSFHLTAQAESKQRTLENVNQEMTQIKTRLDELAAMESLTEEEEAEQLTLTENYQRLSSSSIVLSKEVEQFNHEAGELLRKVDTRRAEAAAKLGKPAPQSIESNVNTIEDFVESNYFYPDSDEYKIQPWTLEILFKNLASGTLGGERMIRYEDALATVAAIVKCQWNPLDSHSSVYFPPSIARQYNLDMPTLYQAYLASPDATKKHGKPVEEIMPILEGIVKEKGGNWDALPDYDKKQLVNRFEHLRRRNDMNRYRLDYNPDLHLEVAWLSQFPPRSVKSAGSHFRTPLPRGQFDKLIRSMAVSGHFSEDALIKKHHKIWPIKYVARPINEVSQQYYDHLGKKSNDEITLREFVDTSKHFGKLRQNHCWYYDPDNYTNMAGMDRLKYAIPYKVERLKQQLGLAPKPMHQVISEKNSHELQQKLNQGEPTSLSHVNQKKRNKKSKGSTDATTKENPSPAVTPPTTAIA